jgi:hypothetical protein
MEHGVVRARESARRVHPMKPFLCTLDERPVTNWPLRLELQNVGTDPGLCWKFGDETYCH